MSSINPTNTVAALNDKLSWEDPSIVLERDLIARAQGGPPGNEEPWAPRGMLGVLNVSATTGSLDC